MIRPIADDKQGHIAGHKRSLLLWIGDKTAFTRLGARFFPGRLTGRVNKARESIHNDIIVRFYGGTVNT